MSFGHMSWARAVWLETEDIPLAVVKKVMRKAHEVLIREILKGGIVALSGLGIFGSSNRAARKFWNPAESVFVDKPAARKVHFKLSASLKKQAAQQGLLPEQATDTKGKVS